MQDPPAHPRLALQQVNQRKHLSHAPSFHASGNTPSYHDQRHTENASHRPHLSQSEVEGVSELAVYLARRDLVTAGLKVFDNQPASYLSWKSSFINAVEGLNLKPSEELDLLIKWLGGVFTPCQEADSSSC